MNVKSEFPGKNFQLPKLGQKKLTRYRTAVFENKRNSNSTNFSLSSPRKCQGRSLTISETQKKLKHLIPPYISAKT